MRLGVLYHWSPTDRRAGILEHGLLPAQPNTVASCALPYVCLGFSPAGAWAISGDTIDDPEEVSWDLWQVQLDLTDQVAIQSEFGPVLREVNVANPIPPARMWWVGTRH
jgi:hypothetical protein